MGRPCHLSLQILRLPLWPASFIAVRAVPKLGDYENKTNCYIAERRFASRVEVALCHLAQPKGHVRDPFAYEHR